MTFKLSQLIDTLEYSAVPMLSHPNPISLSKPVDSLDLHQLLPSVLEIMQRKLIPSQGVAFGLSFFLFTFMFLPTLVILLAVVVFFSIYYPKLRKSVDHSSS